MSAPRPTRSSSNASDSGSKDNNDATVAKTAGFVVFSGIAMSLLKALNPYNNHPNTTNSNSSQDSTTSPPLQESTKPPSVQEPIFQKPNVESATPTAEKSSSRSVVIIKGDTLWGLSRKHGVSVDAIKEANGLKGDTIYAGKKLVIP